MHGGFGDWSQWTDCSVTCGSGSKQRSRICDTPYPAYGGRNCSGNYQEQSICKDRYCPVNGGFSNWGSWSICSKSCGGGLAHRHRVCDNPFPEYGGLNCTGTFVESILCKTNPCPIDGKFGSWEEWSPCSKTCGTGIQNRMRKCNNPSPQYGGQNCTGTYLENRLCNAHNCPIDGGFSEWTSWTFCSASCGGGQKFRNRSCDSPVPLFGGKNCSGNYSEENICRAFPCPIDGYFDEWEEWSSCSRTCGGGIQSRIRDCFDPQHGGRTCTGHFSESLNCNVHDCPVDGQFSDWTSWTVCTYSCGGGTMIRTRQCDNPIPMNGGKNCSGLYSEDSACNTNECPIDGQFSEWNEWTECSQTCGNGIQHRARNCSNPAPLYGGKDCTGNYIEYVDCNEIPCPVDGQFSSWNDWSVCSVSCGGGKSIRERKCDDPSPQFGGKNCSGNFVEQQNCMVNPCPIDGGFSEWGKWSSCSESCGNGKRTRYRNCSNPEPQFGGENCIGLFENIEECNVKHCPIDGAYSDWQSWTACPVSCGGGIRIRQRYCDSPPPSFGGRNCTEISTDEINCSENPCPIDGGFAEWSGWSQCTRSCGAGIKTRNRTCDKPIPRHGGKPCDGHFIDYLNCNIHLCPIDGGFTEWGLWSPCTVSCAGGVSMRRRYCTNPDPRYGGKNCSEPFVQTKICKTNSCPINGGFSVWSSWSICSSSCGQGFQYRDRDCDNPQPKYGGANCSGVFNENKMCHYVPCPIDGEFSDWEIWRDCSTTCGGGTQIRTRECNNPLPKYGGSNCSDSFLEDRECNTFPCPVDGQYTEWSDWSICSATCGGGSMTRTRTCNNPPPQHGGKPCSGLSIEYGSCNAHLCPVDGGFSDWSLWGTCTVTCGGGSSRRHRLCNKPEPLYGGSNCSGIYEEARQCNDNPCPIDGGFDEWSSWSVCSASCGGGLKTRKRTCTMPSPLYGGQNCSGLFKETDSCNVSPCPVNGGFGNWGSWSVCSASCGGGNRERHRLCNSPTPANGGKDCEGNFSSTILCNEFPCPIHGGFTDWSTWTVCSHSCGGGLKTRMRSCTNPSPQNGGKPCTGHFSESLNCNVYNCPIDGGFSHWSAWSLCSDSCGGGTSIRSRSCTNPSPLYGGENCTGDYDEQTTCNSQHCPVDGRFSDWTMWSQCSLSCGGGLKTRLRRCDNPLPQYGGKQCIGTNEDFSSCNSQPCPIDGAFNEWEAWSVCSHSCGGGIKSRIRLCNNPIPAFGGKNCSGLYRESSNCSSISCPIDGGLSNWGDWTQCSASCGGGIQLRKRYCSSPVPQYGGKDCDGNLTESLNCNTHECPIHGKYSEWGGWFSCSVTCGGGTRSRNRTCTNPPPQFGGQECSGDSENSESCNTENCPIDGGYSDWSLWSECTVSCGGGTSLRERTCTNPVPQYGGSSCSGPSNETTECNTNACSSKYAIFNFPCTR